MAPSPTQNVGSGQLTPKQWDTIKERSTYASKSVEPSVFFLEPMDHAMKELGLEPSGSAVQGLKGRDWIQAVEAHVRRHINQSNYTEICELIIALERRCGEHD